MIILGIIIYIIYFVIKYMLNQDNMLSDSNSTIYSIADVKLARKVARQKAKMLIDRARTRLDKNGCIQGFRIHMSYDEIKMQLSVTMVIPSSLPDIAQCTIKYTGGTRKTVIPGSIPLTGDPNFDYRLIIEGLDNIQLLTIFGQETRIILKQLIRDTGKFIFTPSEIVFFIPIISIDNNNTILLVVIGTFINLTRKMSPISDVKNRLLSHSIKDSCPGVRLNNLKALHEYYSMDGKIKNRLLRALFDPDKEVGKFAMKCLGEEGIHTIYTFLKIDPFTRNHTPAGIINAIGLLAESQGEKCSPLLIDYFHKCKSPVIRKGIIKALTKTKGLKVEKFFIKMLHTGKHYFIEDAIISLSVCGTARAVMPLLEFAKKLFVPYDLKVKAHNAVAQIQSRCGPYEKGMLSITETEEMGGALSFSEDGKSE